MTKMEKKMFEPFVLLIFTTLVASLTFADVTCPQNCTCDPVENLICVNISKIPDYSYKGNIETLNITIHNITSLKDGDLKNFTSLKKLIINDGHLKTIESSAFDDIKDTVTIIILYGNLIKELPAGLFKDIPNISLINVTRNDLTVIAKGTFVNMSKLLNLKLNFNKITRIEEGAFDGVPALDNIKLFSNKLTAIPVVGLKSVTNLRQLELSVNKITAIADEFEGQLESLEILDLDSNPIASINIFPNISKSLKILNLQFTNIMSIHADTWKNVPNLKEIYLSGNLWRELNQEMFTGLENVDTIFLMSLPHLTTVGANTFSNMQNMTALHLTYNENLSDIDVTAFSSSNISEIHLRDNKLSTIKENLVNWTSVRYVSFAENPINCDCNLKWMFKPEYKSVQSIFDEIVCKFPAKHAGKGLMTLQVSDLDCDMTHRQRLATGIVVAIFCLVFMTLFVVLFRCRKRISMRCHRYFMYRKYQDDLVFTVENENDELEDIDRPLH